MSSRVAPIKFTVAALVIGAVGACGEAYLLYHELADCLPYKEVAFNVHQTMAKTGVWFAPLAAIFVGAMYLRRRFWLSLILPVILSPLIFAGVYKGFSVAYGLNSSPYTEAVGDFTTENAARQFYSYCFRLSLTGLVIGSLLALLLWFIAKPRKLV